MNQLTKQVHDQEKRIEVLVKELEEEKHLYQEAAKNFEKEQRKVDRLTMQLQREATKNKSSSNETNVTNVTQNTGKIQSTSQDNTEPQRTNENQNKVSFQVQDTKKSTDKVSTQYISSTKNSQWDTYSFLFKP